MALFTAGALLLGAVAQEVLRFNTLTGIRWGAAASAALFYWFTVPSVLLQTESMWAVRPAPGWVRGAGRVVFLALVALWLLDAPCRERAGASTRGGGSLSRGFRTS